MLGIPLVGILCSPTGYFHCAVARLPRALGLWEIASIGLST